MASSTHSHIIEMAHYESDSEKEYCYWDVRGELDFFIVIFNLLVALYVAFFAIRAYRSSLAHLNPGQFRFIYILIALWWLCTLFFI